MNNNNQSAENNKQNNINNNPPTKKEGAQEAHKDSPINVNGEKNINQINNFKEEIDSLKDKNLNYLQSLIFAAEQKKM